MIATSYYDFFTVSIPTITYEVIRRDSNTTTTYNSSNLNLSYFFSEMLIDPDSMFGKFDQSILKDFQNKIPIYLHDTTPLPKPGYGDLISQTVGSFS